MVLNKEELIALMNYVYDQRKEDYVEFEENLHGFDIRLTSMLNQIEDLKYALEKHFGFKCKTFLERLDENPPSFEPRDLYEEEEDELPPF